MNAVDFEQELKKLDPRFSVVNNPNRPGLTNIFFSGQNYDLPVISTDDIRDDVDQSYRYSFPNGMKSRFWTRGEIMGRCETFVKEYNEGKFKGLYD